MIDDDIGGLNGRETAFFIFMLHTAHSMRYIVITMAPKKTTTPKDKIPVFIEPELIAFTRKLSITKGSFHPEVGSVSEGLRRGYKSWLKKEFPYLLKTTRNVDWDEVY